MQKISAGLLMFRRKNLPAGRQGNQLEVFLIHPGGPFFKNNDHIWGIPKGERHDAENLLTCAKREFTEETGINIPENVKFMELGTINHNNKTVYCWAFENDLPENFQLQSNASKFGWPENDQGKFFTMEEASPKIFPAQKEFLDKLTQQGL